MAKESGIGFTVSLDDSAGAAKAITNDYTDLSFSTPVASMEHTGLDMSAIERMQLLRDFKASLNGVFNDAADRIFAVLKTMSSTSVIRTLALAVSGQTLNNEVWIEDHSLNRGADGSMKESASMSLGNGASPTWS